MGVAAYNRGSRAISRGIAMDRGERDPFRPYVPTPRPSDYGNKALAKAEAIVRKHLRGAYKVAHARGEILDVDTTLYNLVDYLPTEYRLGQETVRKAVENVRRELP